MRRLRREPLPYLADSRCWFEVLRRMPCPVWLDSGGCGGGSRYDILAADPVDYRAFALAEAEAVGSVLRAWLGDRVEPVAGVPFPGGVIGYLGYELGRAWEGLGPCHPIELPVAAFGRYDWALVVDHRTCRTELIGGEGTLSVRQWEALCRDLRSAAGAAAPGDEAVGTAYPGGDVAVEATLEWPDYRQAFERLQRYLHEGDIYQANLTRRFAAHTTESAIQLYRRLRRLSAAPYGAFLDFGSFQILSNSPEQFLSLQDRRVTTRPIKGTRPRGSDPTADQELARALAASQKDRAENLMIVDLLRNDLGKVCRPGSITVPRLFAVESFATVHHLVSTVQGKLAPDKDAIDLLRACFPGGSVTGAPKHRAMEVIDELEPVSREVYCGSVFRLGYDGMLDSNIAIRTLVQQGERLYYWAGGGIVADSVAEAEFREGLDKAAAFFRLLGLIP